MRDLILLGAGASIEAGIPDSFDITRRIFSSLRAIPRFEPSAQAIGYVAAGLAFRGATEGEDPFAAVNVEAVMNGLQLLAQRRDLELSPFVSSWHAGVEAIDASDSTEASGHLESAYREIQGELKRVAQYASAVTRQPPGSRLQYSGDGFARTHFVEMVSKALTSARVAPAGRVFAAARQAAIRTLGAIVWITDSSKVSYLEPIFRILQRQSQLTIATLNYDNAVELAAANGAVSCYTGIDDWSGERGVTPPADGVFLLKLHGSIDWRIKPVAWGSLRNRVPHHKIVRHDPPTEHDVHDGSFSPALIFGGHNKLRADGPFLDLLTAFRHQLAAAQQLTVIGYSFRDDHVNEYISRWLNQSDDHRLRIVDPSQDRPAKYVLELIGTVGSRLEFIHEPAGSALARLF